MAVSTSSFRSYSIGCLAVVAATSVKLLLSDSLGADAPFALYGLAVIASGAVGGPRSAYLASVLSTVAGWYFFLRPYNSFALIDWPTATRALALLCEGLLISTFVARIDAARRAAEQATRSTERLQALTSALGAAVTPVDVAEVTLRRGIEALDASHGVFVQVSADDASELEILAQRGAAQSSKTLSCAAEHPVCVAFRTGQAEWRQSSAQSKLSDPRQAQIAVVSLPIRIGARTLGALSFGFERARKVDSATRQLIETLASQAAQAFERAQMFAEEVRARHRLEQLQELMEALSTALTRAEVAEIVVDCGMRIAAADTCTLYVPDRDGSLRLIGDRGVVASVLDRIRHLSSAPDNPSFESVRTGETLWAENEQDYLALYPDLVRVKGDGPRAQAFWSVPLVAEGESVGLLGMGFYAPRRFPPEERAFVQLLNRHCAQALRRAERLEAERAARESAEGLWSSFETTLRSIGDAVIATDTQGSVTLMNPVAEQLTGWSELEAKGRALREVFPILNEQTRREVESPVERVLREGLVVGLANHTVLLHRDGKRETPIDDSGAPIRGSTGKLAGVVLVFRDVSAKKHEEMRTTFLAEASAVLSESLDYRATLARVAQLAVPRLADWCAVDVVSELDGAVERLAVAHIDPAKIQLAHELAQKYPPDPNATIGTPNVLRTGRSELFAEISDEMLQRVSVDQEQLRLGRELRLRSALIVPLLARGRVLGAMTFVWAESTNTYNADDLSFMETLAQRCAIAIDNARLYTAEQHARQTADLANRTKDEFLAIMGHELRNPLAPMVSAVQLMRLRDGHGDDKELAVLERQLRHMMRLVEDLLDLSRVLRDKVALAREIIELRQVVDNAAEVALPLIESRAQRLVLDVPSRGLAVDADPVRLAQVLSNLLTNAAKYSERAREIRVTARELADQVECAIEDDGVGIEPELMPRLFELFSQGKQSIDRRMGGLGIGLAIASRLVKEHGGELTAHSDGAQRGSRFVMRLPRATAEPSISLQPVSQIEPARASKRVLIVDDNEDAGELMSSLVQKLGHETRVAFEGVHALELAQAFGPHIVFLDIGLPGMNGFEVARRMRQLPACATIPIIAVTGYTRESDRQEAASAGFSEHFAKPLGLDRLRGLLDAS